MLKRAGLLENLAGLVVGGITSTRPDQELSYSMTEEEIVLEKVADKSYPVCFHFPSGHFRNNLALKLGMPHQLVVHGSGVTLQEWASPSPTPGRFQAVDTLLKRLPE
jgi:muramoyltetrapeptide carboxypeptidase